MGGLSACAILKCGISEYEKEKVFQNNALDQCTHCPHSLWWKACPGHSGGLGVGAK